MTQAVVVSGAQITQEEDFGRGSMHHDLKVFGRFIHWHRPTFNEAEIQVLVSVCIWLPQVLILLSIRILNLFFKEVQI